MEKDNLGETKLISPTTEIDGLSIADFLDSIDTPFMEQLGPIRYYRELVQKDREITSFTVNVDRNQWLNPETGRTGQLSSLLDIILTGDLQELNNREEIGRHLLIYYLKRMESPRSFPVVPLRYGRLNTMLVNRNAIYDKMARYGLSYLTVNNYCSEIVIKNHKTGAEELMLAFPCDNKEYYLFDGKVFRPLEDSSMTTFGEKRKDQTCYVYENPMDFLAMAEYQHRNHADCFHRRDYHVIVNGSQNVEQACQFLKENSDFREVLAFMPNNEDGNNMLKKLNVSCKGTIVDWSSLYKGYGSLSDKLRCRIPKEMLNEVKKLKETILRNAHIVAREQQGQKLKENPTTEVKKSDKETLYGPTQTIILKGKKSGIKI